MNYEEKYKQALERARQFSEHPLQEDSASIVEYIFHELAESEDELIRKEMLIVFKQLDEGTTICGRNYDYAKWIAWLEGPPKKLYADKVGAQWADQHPSTETINRIIELYKRWYSQQCDIALTDYIKQNY